LGIPDCQLPIANGRLRTAASRVRNAAAIVAAMLMLLVPPAPAGGQERSIRSSRTEQTVTVSRGARLAIDNHAGEVVIRTWDKDAVRVQARHTSRARINVRSTASGVSVSASGTRGPESIEYELMIPGWMPAKVDGTYNYVMIEGAESEVSAETVRGDIVIKGGTGFVVAKSIEGEVIVDGARGRVTASSVNQGIRITGASGDIIAETTNGSISMTRMEAKSVDAGTVNGDIVYDGSVADDGRYSFATHNGDVTVGVPDTSSASFSIRTYNGSIRSSLPTKGPGEPYGRGKRVTYTLGNGGAQVEIESFKGTVRLRRAGATSTGKR
jgi:DUF4097 and DUF4098 domain-containing protein YvlB